MEGGNGPASGHSVSRLTFLLFLPHRHNVSFHLVFPLNSKSPPDRVEQGEQSSLKNGECSTLGKRLSELSQRTNYDHVDAYPVNLLRNVGRRNSKTQFVFVVDVDLMVNSGQCAPSNLSHPVIQCIFHDCWLDL